MFLLGTIVIAVGLAVGGLGDSIGAWIAAMVLYGFGEVQFMTQLNQLLGKLPRPGREAMYFSVVGMAQSGGFFLATGTGPACW